MQLRCAIVVALVACSGEEGGPQAAAPDPSPPVSQLAPAPSPSPLPLVEVSPPTVRISTLKKADAPGGTLAMMSTEDSSSNPVARTVRSHLADLKRCQTRPGTPANVQVVLGFSLAASGRLTALEIKSTDRAFADCIAPAVSAWTFDPPLDAAGKPTSASYELPVHLVKQ